MKSCLFRIGNPQALGVTIKFTRHFELGTGICAPVFLTYIILSCPQFGNSVIYWFSTQQKKTIYLLACISELNLRKRNFW